MDSDLERSIVFVPEIICKRTEGLKEGEVLSVEAVPCDTGSCKFRAKKLLGWDTEPDLPKRRKFEGKVTRVIKAGGTRKARHAFMESKPGHSNIKVPMPVSEGGVLEQLRRGDTLVVEADFQVLKSTDWVVRTVLGRFQDSEVAKQDTKAPSAHERDRQRPASKIAASSQITESQPGSSSAMARSPLSLRPLLEHISSLTCRSIGSSIRSIAPASHHVSGETLWGGYLLDCQGQPVISTPVELQTLYACCDSKFDTFKKDHLNVNRMLGISSEIGWEQLPFCLPSPLRAQTRIQDGKQPLKQPVCISAIFGCSDTERILKLNAELNRKSCACIAYLSSEEPPVPASGGGQIPLFIIPSDSDFHAGVAPGVPVPILVV
mmetsp:Transcript_19692/g.30861  ORF Transcript_19692/g.30861 Transcript_19692/m.30861 type:complete len:377 (+) Transcript_19692:221-1351(+)